MHFDIIFSRVDTQSQVTWQCPGCCSPGYHTHTLLFISVSDRERDNYSWVLYLLIILTWLKVRQRCTTSSRERHHLQSVTLLFPYARSCMHLDFLRTFEEEYTDASEKLFSENMPPDAMVVEFSNQTIRVLLRPCIQNLILSSLFIWEAFLCVTAVAMASGLSFYPSMHFHVVKWE